MGGEAEGAERSWVLPEVSEQVLKFCKAAVTNSPGLVL